MTQSSWWSRFQAGLRDFYVGPYRREFLRAEREEDDLFMLMVCSEALGIPNPAAVYTQELLPVVYDRYHAWHLRMGQPHSPLDTIRCC